MILGGLFTQTSLNMMGMFINFTIENPRKV